MGLLTHKMPMQDYTINNYLTDYKFNPNASDDEIMNIAEIGENLGAKIYNTTIEYINRFSESIENRKSESINFTYSLN